MLDEFQEVVDIDPKLPRLMRAVFQQQPEVGHVYLGSKRHMMRRIFSDENEPFWRSAKQMELGRDRAGEVRPLHQAPVRAQRALHLRRGDRGDPRRHRRPSLRDAGALLLRAGRRSGSEERAEAADVEAALAKVLRSEHAHFSLLWERASSVQRLLLAELAREPGRPLSGDYRQRHNLPGPSTVQRAVEALERARARRARPRAVRIVEPFLAAWLLRDMRVRVTESGFTWRDGERTIRFGRGVDAPRRSRRSAARATRC